MTEEERIEHALKEVRKNYSKPTRVLVDGEWREVSDFGSAEALLDAVEKKSE